MSLVVHSKAELKLLSRENLGDSEFNALRWPLFLPKYNSNAKGWCTCPSPLKGSALPPNNALKWWPILPRGFKNVIKIQINHGPNLQVVNKQDLDRTCSTHQLVFIYYSVKDMWLISWAVNGIMFINKHVHYNAKL